MKDDPNDRVRLYTLCLEDGLTRDQRAGAHNNRGVAYLQLGEVDKAYEDFARSIECDDDFGLPYLNRARIAYARGDAETALADLDQAVRLPPSRARGEAYALRGTVHASLMAFEKALADLDEAIDRDDDAPQPKLMKALIRATAPEPRFRDSEEAVRLAEAAVEETDGVMGREVLAQAYAADGRFEDAAREVGAVIAANREAGMPTAHLEPLLQAYRQGAPAP